MKNGIIRALIELGLIITLFYSNLLMGEYIRGGKGYRYGFLWAISNIFTVTNIIIAVITAAVFYVLFEYLRKQIQT